MLKLFIRWIIVAVSLLAAALLIPGIRVEGTNAWIAFGVMAVVLAFVNAFIRPLLAFLSCGFIVLTMGLFILVVNAFTLWLSSYVAVNWFNVGFYVDGFWAAFWGSIIVSVVSFLLSLFVSED